MSHNEGSFPCTITVQFLITYQFYRTGVASVFKLMSVDGVSTIKCAVELHLLVSMEQRTFSRFVTYHKIIEYIYSTTMPFLKPAVGQDFTDVCPLLDRPPGGGENYLQPVQVARNIELVTRNLPPEVNKYRLYHKVEVSTRFIH